MTQRRRIRRPASLEEIRGPNPANPRTKFRRGREAIEAAASTPAVYLIADCGWGFEVLRDGASIGWVAIGDTPLLPPEYREPGFTVYPDAESSDALAESVDVAGALRYLVAREVADRLARGIVGRDIFQVASPTTTLGDDFAEEDWRAFWIYDPERLTLTATSGLYEIPLKQLNTSASMLNIIFQVRDKPWCDAVAAGMLLAALKELLAPQASLCSWGEERGPIDVAGSVGARAPIT